MTSCPHCNQKLNIITVLGMDNWRPTVCDNCTRTIMASNGSLLLWFLMFVTALGLVVTLTSNITELSKLVCGALSLVLWVITFPLIVKAVPYKKKQYWLPKNRALGYFIYLGIPVLVVMTALFLAAYFKVGM
jgi:hypothetical protein